MYLKPENQIKLHAHSYEIETQRGKGNKKKCSMTGQLLYLGFGEGMVAPEHDPC